MKRSYEGQLLEARERLAAEAEEKAEVEAERMRLEQATGNLQEQLRQQQVAHRSMSTISTLPRRTGGSHGT